jgi:hypothetical protein
VKPIYINEHSKFFSIFRTVIKKVIYPSEEIKIKYNNTIYIFKFQWQDENICGIDVYED